jgi:hypothetical protein
MQTHCPNFSGAVQFQLCEYLLNNEAYTTVIDPWKDQFSAIHVDVAVVGQMFNHRIDGHCLHNHIPRESSSSSWQSNCVSVDVSRMIGMRARSFSVCIAPSFVDQWDRCDIQCSQCHPGLRHVKVVGLFPRALLWRNPQVTSLECLILTTGDFRSFVQELAPSGTPKSLQQLHLWFFVQRDDHEDIVEYGGNTESLSEWMNGTWATLPACPWLTQVSLHAIHNGGFPTHLLDQNPQITSVDVTYPRKAYNFLDSVVLNNAICRLLYPVERNLTDLSFSFTHFAVYDDGFPNVCEQSLLNLKTLTITITSQGLDDTLPTILITCASRTDIHQPREIVVKCNFEGSVCPMRLCLDNPPTGAGHCTLRTNIPLTNINDETTTGPVSRVRPLVVPVIDHIA